MGKLKKKKYVALLLIMVLVIGIISLISFSNKDKFSGLVKVKETNIESKLLSSIGHAELKRETTLGNSTIEYLISFTLDEISGVEKRDAIVSATLTDDESRYASFKEVVGTNISSNITNKGKKIDITIRNVKLGEQKKIRLRVVITNAPNGFEIHPNIKVSEATGDYTTISTDTITVETNTIEGTVKDENDLPVSNIELIAKKDGREVKRTYSNENGQYVFTDLERGQYEIDIKEELYEITTKEKVDVSGSARLNIRVKSVEPYSIETHKYIERLKLIVDGKEQNYTYEDKEEVLETIRKANNLSGEIEYKLVVKNNGEKRGTITRVEDIPSEGLELKEGNNGWEEENGVYYYRPLEGVSLDKNESREVGLVLNISNTNEAKTYINKMTTKGEIYEKVVYILDGQKYKEEEVLEGDKIVEPIISNPNFSGWYTDTNKSNQYNFDLPVKKDMILYGYTATSICTVTFMDFGMVYDRQEIECGNPATEPVEPVHPGYRFVEWIDDDVVPFDPEEPIEVDKTYYSNNDLIEYTITYRGLTSEEKNTLNNPTKYTIESDTITLNNPSDRYDGDNDLSEIFTGWIGTDVSTESISVSIPHGSIGNREYEAKWIDADPDVFSITYILNGGSLEDGVTNPTSYTKFTETFTLNNPSKRGYRFVGWTGTDLTGNTITVTVPQGSRGARTYEAHYEAIIYNITYNLDGGSLGEGITNPSTYTIETPTFTLNNPSKEGNDFKGWTGTEVSNESTTVTVNQGSIGDRHYDAHYQLKKYNVIYMDGSTQFARETVNHGELATAPSPSPTKAHNIFLSWTYEDETAYNFETPVTGDLTLYSSYEEVLPPTITHTPYPEWTNQNVTVTITSDHPEYAYYYNIDGGEIHEYTGPFEVEYNCDINAHSVKENISSVDTLHEVRNIDKIKPTIDSLTLDFATKTTAKIDFENHDNESGLKEVKIYLDDLYKSSFMYSTDVNEHKYDSYTFENLTAGTTYTAKLVSYDYAGNISDASELEFTTRPEDIVVARIITVGNSPLNEEDYIYLPTLRAGIEYNQDGINCNTTQCTIQMLRSVNETNDILGGQDITLDLNGQTVNGVNDYTIKVFQNAEFTLIDDAEFDTSSFNEANHNSLKNETGTSIINNGTLTLGEGNTGDDVSIYVPYVHGTTSGIDTTNGLFNFYDGRVKGNVAISGEVTETPTAYETYVEIKTEDEQSVQVAYLQVLADVEARIGSKYYTRVANAFDEAKNGAYIDILSTDEFLDSFDKIGSYGFIKEGNFLVNENTEDNTTAESSFILDLRDYNEDQLLSISTNRISTSADYGSNPIIKIYEGLDSSGTNVIFYNVPDGENNYLVKLEKGKRYYVELEFQIINDNPSEQKLYITDLSLRDYIEEVPSPYDDLETTTSVINYGFDYDSDTKTYRSNNQYTAYTTAYSYYEVDLTNDTDKLLVVNATLSSYSDTGTVVVKTTNEQDPYSNSNNSLIYINNNSFPKNYGPISASQVLTGGQKYYVQFYYYKGSTQTKEMYDSMGVKDQFIINSLDVIPVASPAIDIDLSTDLVTPGDYGFTPNSSTYATTADITHSYIAIDLTNVNTEKYVQIDFESYYNFFIFVTNSANEPSGSDQPDYYNPKTTGISYYGPFNINLTPGEVNYVHFIMPATSNGCCRLTSVKVFDGNSKNMLRDIKNSSGVSYYFDEYVYGSAFGIYSSNGIHDSYTQIDLRNSDSDVLLTVNGTLPSNGFGYVYLSDGKQALDFNAITGTSVYDTNQKLLTLFSYEKGYSYINNGGSLPYTNRDYNFTLARGKLYYLHFGSSSNWFYVNRITTRKIDSYDVKVGKQRYIEIPQSGSDSNLPSDMVIDVSTGNSLRYVGSTADNYVYFNNELWRIIGVFNTEDENGVVKPRIKIIRNDILTSTNWDASDGSVNNGNGVNEWSQADLMKLLNPGYDNESVDNSLYWNKTSGSCYVGGSNTSNCDFSSTGLSSESKQFIDTVKWYTGAVNEDLTTVNVYDVYNLERGTATGKDNISSADNVTRTTSWIGKVGLPYYSDYAFAAGDYNASVTRSMCMNSNISDNSGYLPACVANNNWMFWPQMPYYSITPTTGSIYSSSTPAPYYVLSLNGTAPYLAVANNPFNVKPAVYLSTKTVISGGDGSSGYPYTLTLGDSDNEKINNYYGLVPQEESEDSGEIIETETADYQNIKQNSIYGFEFDEESGDYVSNNANAGVSTAASYIVIDRTAELEDTTINVISSYSSSNGSGVIVIMEDNYDENVDVSDVSTYSSYTSIYPGYKRNNINYVELKAGKIYYIYFGFKKNNNNAPSDDYTEEMRVRIEGLENTSSSTTVTKYNGQRKEINEEVDTIYLLKDVSLSETQNIEDTKNVILDLNGYNLSSTYNGPIFNNSGILTIVDSGEDGIINASLGSAVVNNSSGHFELQDGKILFNNNDAKKYAIENYGTIRIDEEGTLQIANKGIGIYNSGNILDGTGSIIGGTGKTTYDSTGIYSLNAGFKGYTFKYTIINIQSAINYQSNLPIIISDIKGNANIEDHSTIGFTINNSNFNKLTGSYYGTAQGITTVNNSEFSELRGYNKETQINNSRGSTVYQGNCFSSVSSCKTMYINSSEITEVTNDTILSISSSNITNLTTGHNNSASYQIVYGSISTIIDSTIEKIINYNENTIIKGNTVVNSTILNTGILKIGEDDGFVDVDYPRIKSNSSAIANYTEKDMGNYFAVYGDYRIKGIVEFYDGSITGDKDSSVIKNMVLTVPENYIIERKYQDSDETWTLSNKYIAAIGNQKYHTIQDAIDAVPSNIETEIDILDDFADSYSYEISNDKNIKLDYNGHNIDTFADTWITNNGTLTIYDSKNSSVDNISCSKTLIANNGTLNYQDVKQVNMFSDATVNFIENNGTTNIISGEIRVDNNYSSLKSGSSYYLINNADTLTISGGLIDAYRIINNNENALLNITGGTINHRYSDRVSTISSRYIGINNDGFLIIDDVNYNRVGNTGYFIYNNSIAEVNGGTYSNKSTNLIYNLKSVSLNNLTGEFNYIIYEYDTSDTNISINDSNIMSGEIYSYNADITVGNSTLKKITAKNLTISDSIINDNIRATRLTINDSFTSDINASYITMDNTEVTGGIRITYKNDGYSSVISNSSVVSDGDTIDIDAGNLEINNSNIVSNGVHSGSGWYSAIKLGCVWDTSTWRVLSKGSVVVKNSTITAKDAAIENSGTGTVTLGSNDGNVELTPVVSGGKIGIKSTEQSSSRIYMYDGIVTGPNDNVILGSVAAQASGYTLITDQKDENYQNMYLSSNAPLIKNNSTNITYSTIQDAIDHASNGDVLKFVRNYVVSGGTIPTIPSGKQITIDIDGYAINTSNNTLINNYGDLTITDDKRYNPSADTVGYINNNSCVPLLAEYGNAVIENYGTATISEIQIRGLVHNNENATMNISRGIMDVLVNDGNASTIPNNVVTKAGLFNVVVNNGTITLDSVLMDKLEDRYGLTQGTFINNGTAVIGTSSENEISKIHTIENKGNLTIGDGTMALYEEVGLFNLENGVANVNNIRGAITASGNSITNIGTYGETYSSSQSPITLSAIYTKENSELNLNAGIVNGHIEASDNSKLNLYGGTINAKSKVERDKDVPIKSTSTIPLIIGKKDGNIDIANPTITDGSIRNKEVISSTSGVKFYDGTVTNSNDAIKPIDSNIVDIETNSNVVIEGYDEFLTTDPIVKNVTKNNNYTSLATAFSSAASGDELQLLYSFIVLSNSNTIETNSTDNITLDMNSKKIYNESGTLFDNKGTLTIGANNNSGSIINSSDFITNSGTLDINLGTFNKGIENTSTGSVSISGATLTSDITNAGTFSMEDTNVTGSIVNSGTITYDGGNNIGNITNTGTYTMFDGSYKGDITNSGDYTIKDGEITDSTIDNTLNLTIEGGIFSIPIKEEAYYFITNGGVLNITGGTYSYNEHIKSNRYLSSLRLLENQSTGTANISNVSSINLRIGINNNNMTITDTTADCNISNNLINISNLQVTDSTIDNIFANGSATTNLTRATIDDIENTGTLTSDSSTIKNLKNSRGTVNINNSTITGQIEAGGTVNLNNGTTVLSNINDDAILVQGNLNISSGVSIIATTKGAIKNTTGTVIIGTKDSNYDSSSPIISGELYGIYNSGTLDFYDGTISGKTSSGGAISGSLTDVETNMVVNLNTVDDVQYATLKPTGETERVIIMNNINYSTLQGAVNAAPDGVATNMVLYTNYTLTQNIIVPVTKNINFYLNGYTINYDQYNIDTTSGGTFIINNGNPSGLSGSILGDNINKEAKSIIVYQMEDGNKLIETETYKLYKLIDNAYKIMNVDEEELGEYSIGKNKEIMKTIKGKLYLNGLTTGNYILVSNTSRELNFTIEENSISPNIRINNSSTAKVESSSVAILILTISTGVMRTPWMILILLVLILVIIGIIVIKKKNEFQKNIR